MELLDDSRLTTMRLLTEAYTSLNSLCAEHFAAHGLAAIEFEVLLRLARAPGRQLRMTDLSRHTAMSTSGVTRMVDRLEREGLVARVPCDTDRRSSFAVLTARGLGRLADTVPGHLEILDEWLIGPLTQRQLQGLVAGLRVVRDAVRPDEAPAIEVRAPRRPSAAPVRH
ncbi:MarR family transcriptional regulator [Catellatospora sp. KI3]|uniref:MarR family winged helix-turn-helix transcriptional regulator n=1 Tax=Catellatospora sp. KI3 TaxID=3041620 RepID=UPI002482BE3F|nr:MarR family transcriptional regulator [Catellatospora sp. KI3]MDI1464178.1 MarR family transcriptional regulator [Catellatospora sp. KI3]